MEYSLDTWTSIFLVAAAQGFFLALILFIRKNLSTAILGILVLLFSVTLIEYVLFWTGYRFVFPHLNRISEPFFFLFGPLIYFYAKSLSKDNKLNSYSALAHLIPFIISFLLILPYYVLDAQVKIQYMTQQFQISETRMFLIRIIPWTQILSMGVYTILAYSKIGINKSENTKIKPAYKILFLFSGFIFSFSSYYFMILTAGYLVTYDYLISISMSVFIYGIGYLGYKNNLIVESEADKYQNSNLKQEEIECVSRKLNELMQREKLYLQRDLNLEKLALAANTSKHILSQILNEEIGTKFSDFVNTYRVNEAKELILKRNKELSISGIALESGFNNKTSFNTAFKKFTGHTPTQFLENDRMKTVNSD